MRRPKYLFGDFDFLTYICAIGFENDVYVLWKRLQQSVCGNAPFGSQCANSDVGAQLKK